ncbi:MAG: alanine:cation symporter family protein [Myxococcales bacterium]|nr:alanine:cation symporter family protein [Myxococcales bacterium]
MRSAMGAALALLAPARPARAGGGGIDAAVDGVFAPAAASLSDLVFFTVPVGEAELPLIVAWLVAGAVFFTVYLGFINVRGLPHALRLVTGRYADPSASGEVSHFQALTTAISGTVGVGNISHVAIAISVGGPGAIFWLVVAGFLGMSSKFVECTLAVRYREQDPDGTVAGGPMYYLEKGFAERRWPRLGRALAQYYALCILLGCLGIGSMFQANQAFVQTLGVTGGAQSPLAGRGWLFGALLAVLVALVIVGGIRSIARVTSRLVPFMVLLYGAMALTVIGANAEKLPWAFRAIVTGAFAPEGVAGGALAVLILGFRRAAFSNEAGIGSAAVAHAAVRTDRPITEGYVALLEPFIDTVIICSMTALLITVSVYDPSVPPGEASGVELTSRALASVVPWFPKLLALVVALFAFSTMISWSYYGLAGWLYLFGRTRRARAAWNALFLASVVVGCATQLQAVLDFADALVFAMAFANVLGLYVLAPVVKRELALYRARLAGEPAR